MQIDSNIVSTGDNLHEMSIMFPGENIKKNISKCRLQKILPRVQSDNILNLSISRQYFDGNGYTFRGGNYQIVLPPF